MLKITALCKSFDGKRVLENVSLTVNDGEAVCIMAPSGAGKTTLANIIMGLLKPDSGSVAITPAGAARISCVFQQDRLLPQLNAVQNILFTSPNVPRGDIDAALAAVDMQDDADKPCAVLSGGQRRRVAVIRAMLAQSDIVIADEPFKGLDDAVRAKTAAFIKMHQNGRALLCITHDADDAKALEARIFKL